MYTPSLIARLREGDPAAGGLLDELYRHRLTRFSLGYGMSAEEAEDIVQDVFYKVLRNDTVPHDFRAWVYRICRNRRLDARRVRSRRRDAQELPTESKLMAEITGKLTQLVRGEQHAQARHLVASLPPDQREVVRLRYVEELTRA